MSGNIWVLVEHREGDLRRASIEAIGAASAIAAGRGWGVTALVLGQGQEGLAAQVARHGVSKVWYWDHADLAHYSSEGYATALAAAVAGEKPTAIFMGATSLGKDLAGKLAARLGVGLLADVTKLTVEGDDTLIAERPRNAGKVIVTVATGPARPQLATLRPKAFEPAAAGGSEAPVEKKAFTPPANGIPVKFVELKKAGGSRAELSEADIVVSGGRGLKGPENFHLVENLATALGAAVGASRAVVDAGWRDHSEQVGQTGKTVTPKLYVACAISGAIQHLVGMTNSGRVLAINKDPDAPIFKRADYAIVGDAFEIMPALTEAIKKAREH